MPVPGAVTPADESPSAPDRTLRILMLEDVETDSELIMAELRRARLAFIATRVDSSDRFLQMLDEFTPDLILADFSMPQFSALEALALLRDRGVDLPFILVTGTQTEEIAVRCIQEGADDYILKERMTRLPSAVLRALRNKETELEREQALAALRTSEERYRLITENTRDLICLLDPSGAVLYLSPSCRELLGRAPADLAQGPQLWRLPDTPPAGAEVLRQALGEPGHPLEVACRHANGDWRTFESVGRWILDEDEAPQYAVIVLRDVTDRRRSEEQLRRANTDLAAREMELLDAVSFLERSHRELQAAQLQLIQAEKMESVGRLAAGVAHEVKNPLTVLLMGIEYLRERFQWTEPELVTLVQDMENSARKANLVIGGLLDFSAPGALVRRAESIQEILEEALGLVKHELVRSQVQVVRQMEDDLPRLDLDRNKVEQVFVNLFLNALHAMPDGGTLTLRARQEPGAATVAGPTDGLPARVVIEVEDTGTGIDPEAMAKVFDPFFTTKPPGKGTGLGLTVVKKIVELHGGTLVLQNRAGGGAAASVTFPREVSV